MPIHCATACFPGLDLRACVARLHEGIDEPLLGALSTAHIQLCPQTPGELTEAVCEALAEDYPDTRFRLHANARVDTRLRMLDASTFCSSTLPYYARLADRSRRLGAEAYSLHAGYRANCTLDTMIDTVRRLTDLFGIPVAVEGLYPRADRPQLMAGWAEYEAVMRAGLPIALDLSHLNIVQTKEGAHPDLAAELMAYAGTLEVHVSGNDGKADSHAVLERAPWWYGLLDTAPAQAVVFSEGNQHRRGRTRRNFGGISHVRSSMSAQNEEAMA